MLNLGSLLRRTWLGWMAALARSLESARRQCAGALDGHSMSRADSFSNREL